MIRHGHGGRGLSRSATYRTWDGIVQRTTNPKNVRFKHYGGRGITVCERWLTFENFLADMGERPDGLSIDRINVDGNYEPGNCRWATDSEQQTNRRRRTHCFRGHEMTEANTYTFSDGRRTCVECKRAGRVNERPTTEEELLQLRAAAARRQRAYLQRQKEKNS